MSPISSQSPVPLDASNPFATPSTLPFAFPPFDAIRTEHYRPAFDAGVAIGPLIDARAADRVRQLVADTVASGGRISHQALLPTEPGLQSSPFVAPMVLVDVPADAAVLQEEVFGPVAPIVTWPDDTELLAWLNDSELGLAAYIYAGDLKWALQLAERIDAGMIGLNRGALSDPSAPFGGMKQSGLDREGARAGLRAFTETQYFSIDWSF